MTIDPYKQYGDSFFTRTLRRAHKSYIAQSEKEAPKVLRGAEKAIAEDSEQLRRYRRAWKTEVDQLLQGPHASSLYHLMQILKNLTPESASSLFEGLDQVNWFRDTDAYFRFIAIGLIDEAICRMRVREGLSPIDDSLPGEPPTVFEICRAVLAGDA